MTTFQEVLGTRDIVVPPYLEAQAAVPVLAGAQRQGDVGIFPRAALSKTQVERMTIVEQAGLAVVRGESGGNTHWLVPAGVCRWQEATPNGAASTLLGVLVIEDGSSAYLVHDDEHGANGIGAGTYEIRGKREQAEEIRRVAD